MAVPLRTYGVAPGQVFLLQRDATIVGRHRDCDIVLDSLAVSRQHARIVCIEGRYYIEDLHSRNGTYVNGQQVTQPRLLKEGDRIGVCDVGFIFHTDPPRLRVPKADETAEIPGEAMVVDDDRPPGGSSVMSKLDISSGASALQLHINAEAKLKALVEIGQSLGKALELDDVLARLLDSLFKVFPQADRGFIILRDPQTGRLSPRAVKYRQPQGDSPVRISRTVVNSVMAAKEAILSADAASDARFELSESIVGFQLRSLMCVPLIGSEGNALGAIQIDTVNPRSRFSRDDLDVLAAVACHTAFAVENAQLQEAALQKRLLDHELAVAHEVQRSLLPPRSPNIPGYEFFEYYEPARELGGDYYDYVPLPDGRLAVVVADVAGKGVSAALLMARLSAETRFCLACEPSPSKAVERLNRVFFEGGWDDRFVTLVLVVLDPRSHRAAVVNAGHWPPLFRRRAGVVEAVAEAESRLPLGVEQNVDYPECVVQFAPGDCLVLYTDGITECTSAAEELYGQQRLIAQLQLPCESISALGRRLLQDLKDFSGGVRQSDDICLNCFGRCESS